MRVRLYENYRFVLYAPFYAAHALGAYEDEGVEVELLPSPGPGKAEAALVAGEAEAMWMGPIRIMKMHEQDPASPLTAFAEVVCRDPFSLVGGTPNPGFRLADLLGKRFASVSEVPTPWLCLVGDLHQAGIDPARLERVIGRGMGENVAGLTTGQLDVAQLFEPFVELAVRRGAHVWLPASARGRTAYTVFATTRRGLDDDPEPFRRMVRAIHKTQRWVEANPPAALAELIAGDYFPDLDRGVLAGALTRYKAQGVWASNPVLSQEGFDRLQRALLASGFLARSAPFADCADNTLADEAVRAS
ncbi:MAG TPA: ABC transporter substrate-binding protein [Stellaceae bacterium]|jgi:NitT/TauT family transport system substrate-binding protein|nr:ABC transporter substrate-binding protein [Stellaceae bacterium]